MLFLIGCVELSLLVFFLKGFMYSARERELRRISEQEWKKLKLGVGV
jgi:hypothetical protein